MKEKRSARDIYIQLLEEDASGKAMLSDIPGDANQAKRILSYVSRVPENNAELMVHRLFLALCQRENTSARRMLDFWTEVLDNELRTHCLVGRVPKNPSELVDYETLVHFSRDFSSKSRGFTEHLRKHFLFAIKEFLFKATGITCPTLEGIYRRTRDNPKGIGTFFALTANEHNLIFYHHPDISAKEAASSLRDCYGWWMTM